jgi:hypothetical protein
MKQLQEIQRLKKIAGLLKENVAEPEVSEKEYAEAQWNMDKFMDDNANFDEYYSIVQSKDVDAMVDFLNNNISSEEIMQRYLPQGGSIEGFAQHLINNE